MKPEAMKQFLACLGVKPSSVQDRSNWLLSACALGPWRHDGGKSNPKAFAMKREAGDVFCNCFSCAFHGQQSDLVMEMQRLNRQDPQGKFDFLGALKLINDAEEGEDMDLNLDSPDIDEVLFGGKKALHEFPDWWLSSFDPAQKHSWAMQYLKERKVPDALVELLDLRADTQQKRVCFPVRDFSGALRGLHGRAVGPDPLRYRMYTHQKQNNPIIWYGEHYVDLDRPILVVEGCFDVVSALRVYDNVVSPLFANPSFEKLHRMADSPVWVTLLDAGKGGDIGRQRISQAITGSSVTHVVPPDKETDPGSMTISQLQEALFDHLELRDKPIV